MSSIQDRIDAMKRGNTVFPASQATNGTASVEDRLSLALADNRKVSIDKSRKGTYTTSIQTAPQAEKQTFGDRLVNTLSGIGNRQAAGYAGAAENLLEGLRFLDKQASEYTQKAAQAEKSIQHYQEMLRRGTFDNGQKLTLADRERIVGFIHNEEKNLQIYASGLEATQKPMSNLISSVDAYGDRKAAASEKAIAQAKEGLGTVGSILVDTGVAAGDVASDALLNALIPGIGTATRATRMYGYGAEKAEDKGEGLGKQMLYGAGAAALGEATNRLLNNNPILQKAYGKGALDDILLPGLKATKPGNIVLGGAGEALEETLENAGDRALQGILFGEKADQLTPQDIGYDALIASLIGSTTSAISPSPRKGVQGSPATIPAVSEGSNAPEIKTPQNGFKSDSTAKYTQVNREYHGEILDTVRNHLGDVKNVGVVAQLTGNEFQKTPGDTRNLRTKVIEFFNSIGNKIARADIGEIELNTAGARDSLAHGYGKMKAATFAALPDVLKNGKIIQHRAPYAGHEYDSYIISAPVKVGEETVYVGALVIKDRTQRYKLHEVLTTNENGAPLFKSEATTTSDGPLRNDAPLGNPSDSPVDITVSQESEVVKTNDGVGAANSGFAPYSQLQNQSSRFHPEGANAARPVDVPTEDFDGRNVSQSASTVMGAQAIPANMIPTAEQMVADGLLSYDVVSDASAMQSAENTIREIGWDGAMEKLRDATKHGYVSKDINVLAQRMLVNAANAQNAKQFAELLVMYQTMRTNVGQAMQAGTLLRKMSPEWQLYGVQRSVANLKSELESKYKGKAPDININEGLIEKFLSQQDQSGRDAVMEEIYRDVAKQVPSTWTDKWNAWRYLSMLGNPRTHIRNVVGNMGFQPVRVVKNELAAILERVCGVTEKTKSFSVSPDLYRVAWNDFANVKELTEGNRYESNTGKIMQEREIFETKLLETLRKKNSKALEIEDILFKRITYADSLAQYLKANGVSAEQVDSGTVDKALMSRARTYAAQEALKATYQDSNAISNKTEEIAKAFGVFGEAALPFKRTPANILSRALEYSPAGLAKSLTADLAKVRRGDMTAAQAIDNIASGLTGTGLFALGMHLFACGLVTGAKGDEEEDKWRELLGHQGYALELDDGTSVTLDWLAPESLPFFMGVEFMSAVGENGWEADGIINSAEAAVKAAAGPMLEMSMLQSVNDLLESVSYADKSDKVGALISTAIVSYLSQAVPTIGGQIERSSESVRNSTYTDKNNVMPTDLQYAIGKASAKIPGWDYQQIPYIDAWGRTESTGDPLERAANNLFNPAYMSEVNVDNVEKELQRVYDAVGSEYGTVFPQRAEKSFTVNKETKNLTAEEYVKYAKAKGENSYQFAKQAMALPAYKRMTDSEKAELIADVYAYANYKAKQAVDSAYKHDTYDTYAEAEKQGITPAEYAAYRLTKKDIKADKDKDGKSIRGSEKEKVIVYIDSLNLSDTEKDWLFLLSYASENEKTNKKNLRDLPWNK